MADASDTPSAPADHGEKSQKLLPWQRRIARKAAAMKFGSKRIDLEEFAAVRRGRAKIELQAHLYLAEIMNMTDRQLTKRLAGDSEACEGAGELMIEFAKQAKAFKEYHDVFMHGAMRLLCARARNELGLDRDGKPLAPKGKGR